MISDRTLQELQSKAKDTAIDLAKKVWEHKWIVIPTAILGYGVIKHKVTLKSVMTTPKAKSTKEDTQPATEKEIILSSLEKKLRKNRNHLSSLSIQAKRGSNISFKEEGLHIEDLSTSCQSDKDNLKLKVPIMKTEMGINSGYNSDAESVLQDDERNSEKRAHARNSSCPDDLFFNIFQQLR